MTTDDNEDLRHCVRLIVILAFLLIIAITCATIGIAGMSHGTNVIALFQNLSLIHISEPTRPY